jgi:aspartyl protease family protein
MNHVFKLCLVAIGLGVGAPHLAQRLASMPAGPTAATATSAAPARAPQRASGSEVYLTADARGHYVTRIDVNGRGIAALVDTGASVVAMSFEDAEAAGVYPAPGDRKARFNTANGVVEASVKLLHQVRIENIVVYDVEAAIMPPGAMRGTLLGMSFLRRLSAFESRGGTLVLKP